MANKSGKINLDITSILFALLENLASIDFDLKFFFDEIQKKQKKTFTFKEAYKKSCNICYSWMTNTFSKLARKQDQNDR